jgi:hypothetical protein
VGVLAGGDGAVVADDHPAALLVDAHGGGYRVASRS